MKRLPMLLSAVLLALLAMAGPVAAQAPPLQVGVMEVDGKNAYYNGKRVAARDPIPIYDGDYVSTGKRTSVRIVLTADGYEGYIQLDQNTDPNLIIAARCIVMNMLEGRALINAKNICLGTQDISGVTRSVVNLTADGGVSQLTVIEGSVELERPFATTVGTYQRYMVSADGRASSHAIDVAEAARTIEWTQDYFDGKGSGRGKKAAGILAAIIGAIVIGKQLHDDDDDDRRPPPQSDQPSPQRPPERTDRPSRSGEQNPAKPDPPDPTRSKPVQPKPARFVPTEPKPPIP